MQVSDRIRKAVAGFKDYIQKETLADDIILQEKESDFKLWDINGEKTYIRLQKV